MENPWLKRCIDDLQAIRYVRELEDKILDGRMPKWGRSRTAAPIGRQAGPSQDTRNYAGNQPYPPFVAQDPVVTRPYRLIYNKLVAINSIYKLVDSKFRLDNLGVFYLSKELIKEYSKITERNNKTYFYLVGAFINTIKDLLKLYLYI